jgi:hypothetical protein
MQARAGTRDARIEDVLGGSAQTLIANLNAAQVLHRQARRPGPSPNGEASSRWACNQIPLREFSEHVAGLAGSAGMGERGFDRSNEQA